MRKKNFFLVALALSLCTRIGAQTAGEYFNWSGQEPHQLLEMFRNGVPTSMGDLKDLEFKRSHVRVKSVITDKAGQLDKTIDPRRSIFFNCPIGASGSPLTAMPSGRFDDDVFSMWQYVKIHGNWSNNWFCAPAAYTDAAHKHGTAVLSTWGIPWNWSYSTGQTLESDSKAYFIDMLTKKDEQGNFVYAEPLINLLMYFGMDGINYNSEFYLYQEKSTLLQQFHEKLYQIAAQKGFTSFHVGWYDGVNNEGNMQYIDYLGYHNNKWYCNEENNNKVSDAFMLNYNWGETKLTNTEKTAAELMTPNGAYDVYAGCWIVNLQQAWTAIDNHKGVSIGLWGEHKQNRVFQHRDGLDEKSMQKNYQERLEYVFTGGNQTPLWHLPIFSSANLQDNSTLKNFHGMSKFVTERSTVQGTLPFATNFILGNGMFYKVNGQNTYGSWYNLSAQDMCPTYRWLVQDAAGLETKDIKAQYSFADAWVGGTSLSLSGVVKSTPANIHLYRSDLTVGTGATARLVYKITNGTVGQSSNLRLVVKKNAETEWKEFNLGNITKTGWNEVELPLTGFTAGDKITAIGLRVQGASEVTGYEALIGELKLYDATRTAVNAPTDVIIEYSNETNKHLDAKMFWKMTPAVAPANPNALVYNDEVNVAYFEVFTKEGTVEKQIARTASWAHYVPAIPLADGLKEIQIGIRAVSTDLVTKSAITWKTIVRNPSAPVEAETDLYCKAINDPKAEGAATALTNRFVESASTIGAVRNLSFTGGTNATNGYFAYLGDDKAFDVTPGSTFTFKALATNRSDGMKYCKYTIYADWNCDGIFDPTSGEIAAAGGTDRKGDDAVANLSTQITVPANATPGVSRFRVRYSDAWFPQPGPCGLAQKGYTVDFQVNVLSATGIESASSDAPSFYPNPVVDVVNFSNVDNVKIYNTAGVLVQSFEGEIGSVNLSRLEKGIYIVKMGKNGVVKNSRLFKK